MNKRMLACGLAVIAIVSLSGCQKDMQNADNQNTPTEQTTTAETAANTEYKTYNLYKDAQGGFMVNVIDGWEVTQTNPMYVTLTPTDNNPVKNACIVVAFQTDYTCDNTYEIFLNTMDIKDRITYQYNKNAYSTLGYYYTTPVEENIGGVPVMIEEPTLSLVNTKNSRDKITPKAKFFHYGGNNADRNFMVGYISDEASQSYVDGVVREMIPMTKENRTQVTDRNNADALAYHEETVKNSVSQYKISVPDTWERLDLDGNGTLFRSPMQQGSTFEDCYLLLLSEKATDSNSDILTLLSKDKFKLANATMRQPTADEGINGLTVSSTFNSSQSASYLGLDATNVKAVQTIGRGGTEMKIEEIPDKTERSMVTSFSKDGIRYLIVVGYMNIENNEAYENNIDALRSKLINSIEFK